MSSQPGDDLGYARGILRVMDGDVPGLQELPDVTEVADGPVNTFVPPPAQTGLRGGLNRRLKMTIPAAGREKQAAFDEHDRFVAQVTAVQTPQPHGPTGVLTISHSGGDGKTTLAIALALQSARHRLSDTMLIADINSNRGLAGKRAGYDPFDGLTLVDYCHAILADQMAMQAELTAAIGLPLQLELEQRHGVGVIRSEPAAGMLTQKAFTDGVTQLYRRMGVTGVFFDGPTDSQYSLVREAVEHFVTQIIYVTEPSQMGLIMAMECFRSFARHAAEANLPQAARSRINHLIHHPMVVVNRYDRNDPTHRMWIAQIAKIFPGNTYGVPEDNALAHDAPIRLGWLAPLTEACLLDIAATVFANSAYYYVARGTATAAESGLTGLRFPELRSHLEDPRILFPQARTDITQPEPCPTSPVVAADLEVSHAGRADRDHPDGEELQDLPVPAAVARLEGAFATVNGEAHRSPQPQATPAGPAVNGIRPGAGLAQGLPFTV